MPKAHPILLVEDHEDSREALTLLLRSSGFDVVSSPDGEDAWSRLQSGLRPCLILLDLYMPGIDGLAFRRQQLADDRVADIPVVMLSAGGRAAESAATRLGTHFVRKPADLPDLLAHLHRHCSAN